MKFIAWETFPQTWLMKLCNLHSPLAALAPCRVKVPHVKHLVVLAHVRNSMTTSVLDPAKVAEVDHLEPEFQQHNGVRMVENASILVQAPNKGSPTRERREG